MSHVASPVSIATALTPSGPVGLTINTFNSLSMNPPTASLCLFSDSRFSQAIRRTDSVGVNVLSSDQVSLAKRFAAGTHSPFADVSWNDLQGIPVIDGALARFSLHIDRRVPVGDHVLLVGTVLDAAELETGALPLVYLRRRYGAVAPSHDSSSADGRFDA